uniref:target of Nesh-SH3-like isoform X1 n=1 Tax=Myxine glutinosa TaxID=7769 RepID=UPI00358EAF83
MWPATLLVLLSGMFARGVTNEQKGYPLRPRQFKVLSAGRGLWMTWSPPRLTAERPVTSYRLSYGQNLHQLKSVALPASVRSYLIRDVDRADFGFPYFVLLRAENRRGLSQPVYRVEIPSRGAWVSPVPHDPTYSGLITAKITEIGAPRPPRVVKVHTGSNWSQLNWQRPFSGSETDWRRVRGYFVGFGIPGHPMRFEHLPGHRFSHKVDGLDPESVQVFSVQALNVLGASVPMFRAAHTKRDPTVKGELLVPKKVLVTVVSPEEATITWQTIGLPPNKGSTREYRVRYRRKKNNDRYQYKVTRETELTISNLAPGTTYKLSVRVAQGNRVGRWSHDVLFTTHPGDDGTTGLDSMDDGVAPGSRKRPQSDGEGRQNLSIPRIITADSGVEVKTQPPPTEAATVRLKKTFTPERPESNPSPTPGNSNFEIDLAEFVASSMNNDTSNKLQMGQTNGDHREMPTQKPTKNSVDESLKKQEAGSSIHLNLVVISPSNVKNSSSDVGPRPKRPTLDVHSGNKPDTVMPAISMETDKTSITGKDNTSKIIQDSKITPTESTRGPATLKGIGTMQRPDRHSGSVQIPDRRSSSDKKRDPLSGSPQTHERHSDSVQTPDKESDSMETPVRISGSAQTHERDSGAAQTPDRHSSLVKTPEKQPGFAQVPDGHSSSAEIPEIHSGSAKTPDKNSGSVLTPVEYSDSKSVPSSLIASEAVTFMAKPEPGGDSASIPGAGKQSGPLHEVSTWPTSLAKSPHLVTIATTADSALKKVVGKATDRPTDQQPTGQMVACPIDTGGLSGPKQQHPDCLPEASKTRPTSPQPELTAVAPRGETSPFHATPSSPLDLAGKERYIAPHVNYLSKDPNEPCSLSEALDHFQVSELTDLIPQELQRSTGPPENPPSNLTVVAVEGCHSFVILDWGKLQGDGDNMVTGYLVYSASYDNILQNKWTKKSVGNSFVPIENLNPNTRYYFKVRAKNQKGMGPLSLPLKFRTESNDPLLVIRPHGGEPIWIPFKFKYNRADSLCRGRQYVKRTWYQKFVGVVLCNSLRYKILLGDKLNETFHSIGDGVGRCEDHCQFVDSFMEARTGLLAPRHQLRVIPGYYRDYRQQRVKFGRIGRGRQGRYTMYVGWYECGITIPGSL